MHKAIPGAAAAVLLAALAGCSNVPPVQFDTNAITTGPGALVSTHSPAYPFVVDDSQPAVSANSLPVGAATSPAR
jgi:hypothetical protein